MNRINHQNQNNPILVGAGFDEKDGQTRITRGKNFYLQGGTKETHTKMQEVAIKTNEHLDRKGKTLAEAHPQELEDIARKIMGNI